MDELVSLALSGC